MASLRALGSSRILRPTVTAVALGMAVVVADLGSAQACACGAVLVAEQYEMAVHQDTAVVAWDGVTEDVLLRLETLTAASDAALLFPTPAPAEVSLGDPATFDVLEAITEPITQVDYTWWPQAPRVGGGTPDPVRVLSNVQLGPLDVSVMEASDADGLADWLQEHSYSMVDEVADVLLPYVAEGWYYVAVRMSAGGAVLEGVLQPLHLRFASDRMLYPMRVSAAAADPQFVRTYAIADQQVQRTDSTWKSVEGAIAYAGPLEMAELNDPTLAGLAGDSAYLTVIDQYFNDPSDQIVSDFVFAPAGQNEPFRRMNYQTRVYEIAGLPAGPVLVGVAGLVGYAGLTVFVVVLLRRRLRRSYV